MYTTSFFVLLMTLSMKNFLKDVIYINQTKYAKELLKKFNLEDCKTMSTSMHSTSILSLDETDKKPDIMFSVCVCARFQVDPMESHFIVIKHIFRYLKGTTNLGLCYKKSDQYMLKGYSDADFAGDKIEKENTNGGCHFIGATWSSKREGTIALSTVELLWIKHQLEDYDIFESNIPLLCDNTTGYVQKGTLDLKFISTENQLANIFTKPLPKDKLVHIKNLLDMGIDLTLELTSCWILPFFSNEQAGWEKDYGGMAIVEDELLRVDVEEPYALNKIQNKARIFQ
ncbi:Copia protein, partial [Mucuna pruriens]